jgi:RecA/RadA recombinase
MKIPSRTPIDPLLDGGLQTGIITHVYGPAGSGKTTFALHVSICTAQLGRNVLYFDAEQTFPASRLAQILGEKKSDTLSDRIAIARPASFREQGNLFSMLTKSEGKPWGLQRLALVVVDTIASNYRVEAAEHPYGRVFRDLVEKQMSALLMTARKFDIAVLILNQVSSDLTRVGLKPVAGDAISRYSKCEIKLEIDETMTGMRSATIEKTPSPDQRCKRVRYLLTSTGMA